MFRFQLFELLSVGINRFFDVFHVFNSNATILLSQVKVSDKWGTVCNYGWTMRDAALVCHQLGLTLDRDNWFMERSQIPNAGTNEDIVLSNVQCNDDDVDVSRCKAETINEFENSCTHENDVGVRCSQAAWAGLRLGPLALRSDLQYITIERAGLLDYATNSFKPGKFFVFFFSLLFAHVY